MTDRIKSILSQLKSCEYKKLRTTEEFNIDEETEGLDDFMRSVKRLEWMLKNEEPRFIKDDRIGFYRYIVNIPNYKNTSGNYIRWHEGNITPNYERFLEGGFKKVLEDIAESRKTKSGDGVALLDSMEYAVNCVLDFCKKYREAAKANGFTELYDVLERIPYNGATTFYEALVMMKIMIYTLRCSAVCHLTLGRFDKYMNKYFEADRAKGVPEELLLEYIEEFFLSINFDTDTYQGVQLGDNGQSLVLGGREKDGEYRFTDLSRLCMEASLELNLIDPKINLRVDKNTPDELYLLGTKLTKKGLGFPQYANDDVVIPGLIKLGYAPEDAVEYTVAACWEFIIPGKGRDVPNIRNLNFPLAVSRATDKIKELETFEDFTDEVVREIRRKCDAHMERANTLHFWPAPYLSIFVDDCIGRGLDNYHGGAIYNNYGLQGVGIAVGADIMAAIKKCIYEEKSISKDELLAAIEANYEGYEELRAKLLACPKMGSNDDYVDEFASLLMKTASEYINGKPNARGGIFRVGTGSAQAYIWSANDVKATADGRLNKEPFGSSFSPSLLAKPDGPLSIIKSFTKYDLSELVNGGPMTLEIHDTTFRNEDGITKVAMLVKSFIKHGGHQLQLNAINREVLLDAQKNPEKYPNLIVRVWGWSGYWNELDNEYREHIIRRAEYVL